MQTGSTGILFASSLSDLGIRREGKTGLSDFCANLRRIVVLFINQNLLKKEPDSAFPQ
jgi:hypothetical protein